MAALVRMGFSLNEVRTLTMADFVALTDVAYGEDGRVPQACATQADIDGFMS